MKKVDWNVVAQDRRTMSASAVATKHRVSPGLVYKYTRANGTVKKAVAPVAVNGRSIQPKARVPKSLNGHGRVGMGTLCSDEVESLKQKRDVLDRAIATLESAG